MRTVPKDIADKLIKNIQTKGTSANPSTVAWISRPTTALTDDTFLEKQTVLDGTFTDVSIAVCHPYFGATNTKINLAYVSNGKANVMAAIPRANMASHEWYGAGFSEDASAVAIAYNGTMPKNVVGKYEFVTELQPWVFWVSSGALYARLLGSSDTVTLAEANCTDVTAVRAMWSDVPGFDFGLCVFFILSGVIYYRQFIDGVWGDAEPMPATALPTGKTWVQISAQRTWDYRVVLQIVDNVGDFYEVFTQFCGIGSKNAEHIEVRDVSASSEMVKVYYKDVENNEEHIEINNITCGALYGGLYDIGVPRIVSALNADDGSGNYGKKLVVLFDIHLNPTDVSSQFAQFSVVDTNGISYSSVSAILGDDGKTVTLGFADFNNAMGECTAKYTAGTINSMYGTALLTTTQNFVPTGLVPTFIPLPEVSEVTNV